MSLIVQNILVLLVVAVSAVYLVRCARRSLTARCGEKGSCCSRKSTPAQHHHAQTQFLPIEMLARKK